MALMQRTLRQLLPDGSPWRLAPTFRTVVDALGLSLGRARAFVDAARDESIPSRADATLAQWYQMLGLPYDATQTLATRRALAKQAYTATGGQSLDYLNAVIAIAFPDVEIEPVGVYFDPVEGAGAGEAGVMFSASYPSWLTPTPTDGTWPWAYYRVIGEVNIVPDLTRLLGLLDRIAPAEMVPVLAVDVRSLTETAQAGLGMCGLMEAGRI